MFGSDGWWNDPTDPRNMPSIPAGMQGDQLIQQQMAIADAEARKPEVPWYMRKGPAGEQPNPVDQNAPPLDPSVVQRQFQPQRNQLTREAYESMLSNPNSFFVGGPSHSEASSWARTLANMTQSPFGGSMFGSRFGQFPYMSMGLGSMLGYGSPMMGGYNSYSFRGMPYGGYSQPMMGGMSYGGYGYPMMGGYGPQMMGGYGYPMMGYSGYSSPMMGGYSPYGFSGMMGGLGSLFGSSSGSSGENPYGSPL